MANWTSYKELSDSELRALTLLRNKNQYIRLQILQPYTASIENTDKEDLLFIEGLATGGNINVDGKSAVRRNGSLSFVAGDTNIFPDGAQTDWENISNITTLNNLIAMDKEIKVSVGIQDIDSKDAKIYEFPLGNFLIKSASISYNTQGLTISCSITDYMARLNGELGGTLSNAITHSPELIDTGELDEKGEKIYNKNPILIVNIIRALVQEFAHLPNDKIILWDFYEEDKKTLKRIKNTVRWIGDKTIYTYPIVKTEYQPDSIHQNTNKDIIKIDEKKYVVDNYAITTVPPKSDQEGVDKYNFNDNIGYQYTDYTYPGELSSNAGETVVSVLDKIKNALGNYEYFFDLDGNFVFQKIRDYIDEGSAEIDMLNALAENYLFPAQTVKPQFEFNDAVLVNAYQNQPQWNSIKNDITVWGSRNDKVPIWFHLIINKKYQSSNSDNLGKDWRSQLYLDFRDKKISSVDYWYPYAKELFEQWPEVFNIEENTWLMDGDMIDKKTWLNNLTYFFDALDPCEIVSTWDEMTDEEKSKFSSKEDYNNQTQKLQKLRTQLSDLSIEKIGARQKVLPNNKINTIFSPDFPNVVYIEAGLGETTKELRAEAIEKDNTFVQVPTSIAKGLSIGSALNPAYDNVRAILHETTSFKETIQVSCIPVFHLQPNELIYVKNEETGIDGNYMLNSFSIPLDINGIMNLSCSKALRRI